MKELKASTKYSPKAAPKPSETLTPAKNEEINSLIESNCLGKYHTAHKSWKELYGIIRIMWCHKLCENARNEGKRFSARHETEKSGGKKSVP